MSIRISDMKKNENFGALSNLLLSDKLEKLDEDSNTNEGNSNLNIYSPFSSSSNSSPKFKNGFTKNSN